MSDTSPEGRVRHNCWTCTHDDGSGNCDKWMRSASIEEWCSKHCTLPTLMPRRDADGCPGWGPKAVAKAPPAPTKRRTCATPGCTRIASGGAKHCRTCRAERPWREKVEQLRRMLVDSEQATRAADEHVAVLKRDRDEAANENCAWLSLGSVTPGDWDGGADEWFRSFSLWVEGGARLEDWTDESGEGTVIGIVSSMARERDAAVKELGDRVYLLTIERDEAVKALGVSRGVVRGQKERLRRAKAEIATTLDRLQAAHGERDSATATVRHLTEQVGALTIDLDEWRTAHDAIDGMHTVALKERDDWRKVAEENADERREVRAESDALRLRLRIMYAVAVLLGVAAVVGGVL